MNVTFIQFISVIGAIQGILLSLLLFFKPRQNPALPLLGAFVLIFSLGLLESFCQFPDSTLQDLLLILIGNGALLYGPLLYLFVKRLIRPTGRSFHRHDLFHFLPFLVAFTADIYIRFVAKDGIWQSDLLDLLFWEAFVFQVLTYFICALRMLNIFRKKKQLIHPEILSQTRWLKNVLVALLSIFGFSILLSHIMVFGGGNSIRSLYLLVQLGIAFVLYYMSYQVMAKPQTLEFQFSKKENNPPGKNKKYLKSGLKSETADQYLEQLLLLMRQEKPYLDQQLNIQKLAERMQISRNHLTEIINARLKKNFYRFINEYRVKEAQELMKNGRADHFSLTGIGLEAGFNSKAAFNDNFKKITGRTPSQWREELQRQT